MKGARVVLAALALAACRRGGEATAAVDAGIEAATPVEAAAPAPAVVGARCGAVGGPAPLPALAELEIGDAVATADGLAVPLAYRSAAGRVAAAALLGKDLAPARVVELGPTLGDAPPPHLAVRGRDVLAASYAVPRKTDARELRVQAIPPAGDAKLLGAIAQGHDDSLDVDLTERLVVWDDATTGASPRGVVRLADVSGEHPGPARDVSPADADAEMPRLVPWGTGAWVLWIARRPEPGAATDAAVPEATGDPRAFAWIEAASLDAAGAVTGPVRRLTPQTGHVSAYDVLALRGEGKPSVLVVARDDGEATDGSGGSLLRVRLRDDGADAALAFPGDGLGRGAPSLLDGAGKTPWLAWVGPHEEMRLLPLDAAGVPVAPPSAETALGESQPLLVVGSDPVRMLVGAPGAAAGPGEHAAQAELRVFDCSALAPPAPSR